MIELGVDEEEARKFKIELMVQNIGKKVHAKQAR